MAEFKYQLNLEDGSKAIVTLDREVTPEELNSPAFRDSLSTNMAAPGGPFQSGVPGAAITKEAPDTLLAPGTAAAIPENIGGTIGEMVGTPGGFPGRVAGEFLGGAAGRAGSDLVTRPDMGLVDRAKSAGAAGVEQVVGGEGLRVAGQLTGKAFTHLRPYIPVVRRSVAPEINDSLEFFSTFADPATSRSVQLKGGLNPDTVPLLSPGDMLQSPGLRTLENIARGSVISGGDMMQIDKNLDVAVDRSLNEIIREFGPNATREDVGKALQLAIQDKQKAADLALTPIYNEIKERTTPVPVRVLRETQPAITRTIETGLLDDAGKPITRSEAVPAVIEPVEELQGGVMVSLAGPRKYSRAVAEVARDLNSVAGGNFGDELVKKIEGIEDLPFPEVQDLRERLLLLQRKAKESGIKSSATRQLNRLVGSVDKAMETALEKQAPDLVATWRGANAIHKRNADKYQNRFILQMMRLGKRHSLEGTETFARVFQTGKSQNVDRLFTAIQGDEPAETFARQVFLKKIIDESKDDAGRLSGTKFVNSIMDETRYSAAFSRAFSPAQQDQIRQFAKRLDVIQRAQDLPGDSRNPWLKYAQIGAILGMASGRGISAAAPILITPAIMAKLLSSPTTTRLMTKGLRLGTTSQAGINVMRRLTLEVAKQQALAQGDGETALPEPMSAVP